MHPFSRREVHRIISTEPFIRRFFSRQDPEQKSAWKPILPEAVARGSMPTVCLRQVEDPEIWFRGFEQTYLKRDVRELSRIGDLAVLRKLLRLTALRSGQPLSPSQLGRGAKLTAPTTSRYLSLFEASFLLTRIQPYLGNRASRLIKSPKLYLSDSGLTAYLCGLDVSATIRDDPLYGALLETYVAQNLLSILSSEWPKASLHFWAVQGRHEVDFVIEEKRFCIALELKATARWREKDLAGLKAFLSATPHCKAGILCHNGDQIAQLGPKLWALPIGLVLM
jgi:hypothetical protein